MNKLAISIITFNRAKHIREDLKVIADATARKGIDIYIFDGSTNNETRNIVESYERRGYKHIYYFHYENNVVQSQKRMEDALFFPEAEYIWFCGDKFLISPENYDLILFYLNQDYDMVTMYDEALNGIKRFIDPVKYVEYCIVPFTHFGATIIKKQLLNGFNIGELRNQSPSYWKTILYILAISKREFKGIALHINHDSLQIDSRYITQSGSYDRMWDIWVKDWYEAIMSLPRQYNSIKKVVLNRIDREMKFFSTKELLRQRIGGQFDLKRCFEYRKYFPKVIVLPATYVFVLSMIPRKVAKVLYKIY